MKIELKAPTPPLGRELIDTLETRLFIKDRLRVQVKLDGESYSLESCMDSLELERALRETTDCKEIEVEIPDDAQCDPEKIRNFLTASLNKEIF